MAQRSTPSIPGLYFKPNVLISEKLAASLSQYTQRYFKSESDPGRVNQVMFFGRASEKGSGLPPLLDELLVALSALLKDHIPAPTHALLFPPAPATATAPAGCGSRQAILNHYVPGEGITPHVDLLTRFADGIVGVSLGGGTVMTFRRVEGMDAACGGEESYDVYLPERSVLVLTGDARYKWTHGIEGRVEDCVVEEGKTSWIKRKARVSITFRWLLPGADIVGDEA